MVSLVALAKLDFCKYWHGMNNGSRKHDQYSWYVLFHIVIWGLIWFEL